MLQSLVHMLPPFLIREAPMNVLKREGRELSAPCLAGFLHTFWILSSSMATCIDQGGENSVGLPQGLCHRVENFAKVHGSDQQRTTGHLTGPQGEAQNSELEAGNSQSGVPRGDLSVHTAGAYW